MLNDDALSGRLDVLYIPILNPTPNYPLQRLSPPFPPFLFFGQSAFDFYNNKKPGGKTRNFLEKSGDSMKFGFSHFLTRTPSLVVGNRVQKTFF